MESRTDAYHGKDHVVEEQSVADLEMQELTKTIVEIKDRVTKLNKRLKPILKNEEVESTQPKELDHLPPLIHSIRNNSNLAKEIIDILKDIDLNIVV
jgi:predicted RNase H-like nuclease (RuvC/YqgF family)